MFLLLCSCMFLGINKPSFLFFFYCFLHLKDLLLQFRCTCAKTINTYDTIQELPLHDSVLLHSR